MPAGRRAELLHWAARAPGRRYIIEDDYDSEFRFDTRPLPSLQGMAGADGPVVYLSTCSRSLAPGIRIAYMVLPRQLLGAWQAKYRLYSGTVGRFEQQTLARFITGGYFTRHLARERTAYKARRDALVAALRTSFAPEELTLAGLHTGLHLLAVFRHALGEVLVGQFLHLGFERVDARHDGAQAAQVAVVLAAENLFENETEHAFSSFGGMACPGAGARPCAS